MRCLQNTQPSVRAGEIVTDQEIAHFMDRLQQEDEMLDADRVRRFDGSLVWKQLSEQMAEDVRRNVQSPPTRDGTA